MSTLSVAFFAFLSRNSLLSRFFLFVLEIFRMDASSIFKTTRKPIFPLQLNQRQLHLNSNLRSIATGSWGCGERNAGDPQFKVLIQWLAASIANVPSLIYYTCSRESLSKLDTVVRVLHGESRRILVVYFEILRKFLVFCTLI